MGTHQHKQTKTNKTQELMSLATEHKSEKGLNSSPATSIQRSGREASKERGRQEVGMRMGER